MGKLSAKRTERVENYLLRFSKEERSIRDELASVLSAYNELLNMHALSFEEFALMRIAEERGLPYQDPLFSYDSVLPPCPKCGEETRIRRIKGDGYVCSCCKEKYRANWNSISSGSKCSAVTWLKLLHCLLNHASNEYTYRYCGISANTYYQMRNKLFYAMELMMQRVNLYGVVQCDNTFIRTNYRGMDLSEQEYPEGCGFDVVDYIPRSAKKRGARNASKEQNENALCIFTAIDDRGHVLARLTGVGCATASRLSKHVGAEKFLQEVPAQDPFPYKRQRAKDPESKPGDPFLLVSDGEAAIAKYAAMQSFRHEAHVYREKGQQRMLPAGAHDIQRVNSLHSRLKAFFRDANYISSKYLPGYLILFEFIENTGATEEAIRELFQILATPGLAKSNDFYKNLYSTPNYYVQWLDGKNPLKKFSHEQLLAYYLYKNRRLQLESNMPNPISMNSICEDTGYCSSSVRRIYKNLMVSGYDKLICEYFDHTQDLENIPAPKRSQQAFCTTPVFLAIYDEWVQEREKPYAEHRSAEKFLQDMQKKYGVSIERKVFYHHCKLAIKKGLRPQYQPLKPELDPLALTSARRQQIRIYEDYNAFRLDCRKKGIPIPKMLEIAGILGKRYGLTPEQTRRKIEQAQSLMKRLKEREQA